MMDLRHMKNFGLLSVILIVAFMVALFAPRTVSASFFPCPNSIGCGCEPANHGPRIGPPGDYVTRIPGAGGIRGHVMDEHNLTADHILEEFQDMENFMVDEFWLQHILPSMMMMTEQMTTVSMAQMFAVGNMIDGERQLRTQRVTQRLTAEAHKDYHPDQTMCVIGTNMRSLAAAERNAEYTSFVLSQRSQDRQMGNMRSSTARGQFDNMCFRMRQFREYFCDLQNNNERMEMICEPDRVFYEQCEPDAVLVTSATKNKDISYGRLLGHKNTLDIDFYSDGSVATLEPPVTQDSRAVFALASTLFSHDVLVRIPEVALMRRSGQNMLIETRSVAAKRSVIEHSFNHIVGTKAQGTTNSQTVTTPYMTMVWRALGITDASDLQSLLGDRPSYHAQMEILTKRLFQQPEFYTNLYDETANIGRKSVALQAIGLMQNFDLWQSHLRTEMSLSIMLEMEIMELQQQVLRRMGRVSEGGVQL
jgi:hypothetical protein